MIWIPLKFFIVFGVAIVSGIAAVLNALYGPRAQARKRLRSAARELADGAVVTLTGTVRAHETVTAPLSGREGVAFSAMARIYEQHGRQRTIVDRIAQTQFVDFVLETKDGPVNVETSQIEIEFPPEPLIPRKIEREQAYLDAGGRGNVNARNAGFDEIVITAGMKISVHGAVRIEIAPGEATYREAGKKIVLAAPPGHPLTIGRPV